MSRSLVQAGYLVLGLGMVASIGCLTIQVGGNSPGEAVASASRPRPVESSGIQQVNYTVAPTTLAAGPPMSVNPASGSNLPLSSAAGTIMTASPGGGSTVIQGTPVVSLQVTAPPTEMAMLSLPPYRVEPPDILVLDTIRMVPKGPALIAPQDQLLIRVAETLPNQPIDGLYSVSPEGTVHLGYSYGTVQIGGMTLEDAEKTIRLQLTKVLDKPQVAVGLAQQRGYQSVRGTHLVRPDGTISLGGYGSVYVAGLTLFEVKIAIERHLSNVISDPEITVDVIGYNSKVIYVIADGAGYGQSVFRLPVTGKDTVLDVIAQVQGLSQVASKKHIWVARPAPAHHGCLQILPVDWRAITEGGATTTNYQLFPGDRVYVGADPLIRTDNALAKALSPLERILGFTLLGSATINNIRNIGNNGSGVGGAAFIAPIR